jgi:hypothetical protein
MKGMQGIAAETKTRFWVKTRKLVFQVFIPFIPFIPVNKRFAYDS